MRDRSETGAEIGPQCGTDPVLAKGRLWFAEARRDSARDAAEVEDWARRRKPARDDSGNGGSMGSDDDASCGGDGD